MIYIFVARSGPDPENCQLQRSAIYIYFDIYRVLLCAYYILWDTTSWTYSTILYLYHNISIEEPNRDHQSSKDVLCTFLGGFIYMYVQYVMPRVQYM